MPSPLERQVYLINLLRNRSYSKAELIDKVMINFDLNDYSDRSFERDKSDIETNSQFPSIGYNRAENSYYLNPEEVHLLDQFEGYSLLVENEFLLSSINKNGLFSDKIIFETRKFAGTKCLPILKKAIDEQSEIKFDYFYYDTQETKTKIVKPYRLKLKDFRWYLLAQDDSKADFKSYGLERISNMHILCEKFELETIDFNEPYRDAFAMFTDGEAEKVILEFSPRDGNYLRSNPIHHSQKVTTLPDGVQIELHIKPTLDLIMELMKRTWSLKIIEPLHLKETFVDFWKKAIERNTD